MLLARHIDLLHVSFTHIYSKEPFLTLVHIT